MLSGVHRHYSWRQRAGVLETVRGPSPGSYLYCVTLAFSNLQFFRLQTECLWRLCAAPEDRMRWAM